MRTAENGRDRGEWPGEPRSRCRLLVEMSKLNLNYSIMIDKYRYASPSIVLLFGKIYFFLTTFLQFPQVALIVSPAYSAVLGMPARKQT